MLQFLVSMDLFGTPTAREWYMLYNVVLLLIHTATLLFHCHSITLSKLNNSSRHTLLVLREPTSLLHYF